MITRLLRYITVSALMLPAVRAQIDTGRITGTITDASNAVVPNSAITVKNEKTGQARKITTSDQGVYIAAQLGPSTYTITAEANGMAPAEYRGVTLQVGQERTLNITLQPAAVTTEVNVSGGDLVVVDTSSSAISGNVSEREVAQLPINGRQISQLYLMTPGAVNFGAGTFDDMRFNGRSYEENAIRYDGIEGGGIISNNPSDFNGEIPGPFRLQASMENVQEFRVESNNYPAEFGTGTGGQISVITKSGGNALHGNVFEYFRNDALDARNFFDGASPSILRLNQFGGSVGGPIVQNKLFFFAGFETLKQRTTSPFIESTPSAAVRALPDCPPGTPQQAAPTCMNAAVRPLLQAFPVGQFASANPLFEVVNVQEPGSIDEYSGNVRFDYVINDRNRMYARYQRDQGYGLVTANSTGSDIIYGAVPQNSVVALNQVLRPNLLNEIKFGLNAPKTRVYASAPNVPGLDLSGVTVSLSGVVSLGGTGGQQGSVGIASPTGQLKLSSALNGRAAPYTNYSLSFIDNLTWIRGSHNLKFGVEIRPEHLKTAFDGGTTYSFANIQAFLADAPSQVAFNGDTTALSPFTGKSGFTLLHQVFYIGYVQDEWKIRPDFTMSYGLRYEYYSPLHESNDKVVWFDVPTGTLIPNYTKDWYTMKTTNFGPRLGFAWAPEKLANKTVFRIGSGYYYGPGLTEGQTQPASNDRINRTITSGPLLTYPVTPDTFLSNYNINDPNLQFQPRAYLPDYKIPEQILQYSASVQQQLPANALLTVAYVGSQGRNLFVRGITNRITGVVMDPTTGVGSAVREFSVVNGTTVTNRFAEIDTKTSGGRDNFNGLQVLFNRRFSRGFTLGSQYMWSHSIGDSNGSKDARTSSNNYSFTSEHGDNISDVRQSFNASALYEVPYGAGKQQGAGANRVARAILGGWQIGTLFNARTGLPLDVEIVRPDIVYRNNVTGAISASPVVTGGVVMTTPVVNVPGGGASRNVRRPDVVPGVNPYYVSNGTFFINPAAFAVPQPGTYGNLGRDALRGPSIGQLDLTMSKKIPVTETKYFEFRAECYNLMNSPVFAAPGGGTPRLNDATGILQPGQPYTQSAAGGTFGALTSTVSNQVGSGTNRQFQLALRFNF
ncbi:MAG TPA: TonB-dependent receptor [Bryobacteraceae bacterium]|nr:TonB-dependent receptor [Bryobacteraceae bacterium]